jgi:hypothetical protein
MGADGKELDVYYNPDGKSDKIFRVIQLNTLTKEFDEYKIMLGFDTIEDAKQGYLVHYPEGWVGCQARILGSLSRRMGWFWWY